MRRTGQRGFACAGWLGRRGDPVDAEAPDRLEPLRPLDHGRESNLTRRVGLRREGRHRRSLLLVVLGRSPGARGPPGAGAPAARARRPDRHGPRPARPAHVAPPPEAGAARPPAGLRHPGRAVGDRARPTRRFRTSSSARRRSCGCGGSGRRSSSTSSTSTSRTRPSCPRSRSRPRPARSSPPATRPASGSAGIRSAGRFWRPLGERIDYRIAVSEAARRAAEPHVGGPFDVIPNGIDLPPEADPGGRNGNVVFIGRNEPRKGAPGAPARLAGGRTPGPARACASSAPTRSRCAGSRGGRGSRSSGVDLLGAVSRRRPHRRSSRRRACSCAPSLGGESFGMVLTRAFASRDAGRRLRHRGLRAGRRPRRDGDPRPARRRAARSPRAVVELLADEERRRALGARRAEGRRAVLLGPHRAPARRDLRAARGAGRGGQGGGMRA